MMPEPTLVVMLFAAALSILMLWVILSDAATYVIPNTLNCLILALYVPAIWLLPIHPLPALAAGGIVLAVGLGMFALGLMGGGDVKLLVALSVWTGWGMTTLSFLFLTAIFGGLLVIIVVVLRVLMPPIWLKARPAHNLPRLLTAKQPVPYGIAIAAAFLWLLWTHAVPGLA